MIASSTSCHRFGTRAHTSGRCVTSKDWENPRLFGVPAGLEFVLEAVQIGVIDNAEVEHFFQRLPGHMLPE